MNRMLRTSTAQHMRHERASSQGRLHMRSRSSTAPGPVMIPMDQHMGTCFIAMRTEPLTAPTPLRVRWSPVREAARTMSQARTRALMQEEEEEAACMALGAMLQEIMR